MLENLLPVALGIKLAGDTELLIIVALAVVGPSVFFSPSIIALCRRHSQSLSIVAMNLFIGPTIIGWAAVLVWSMSEFKESRGHGFGDDFSD